MAVLDSGLNSKKSPRKVFRGFPNRQTSGNEVVAAYSSLRQRSSEKSSTRSQQSLVRHFRISHSLFFWSKTSRISCHGSLGSFCDEKFRVSTQIFKVKKWCSQENVSRFSGLSQRCETLKGIHCKRDSSTVQGIRCWLVILLSFAPPSSFLTHRKLFQGKPTERRSLLLTQRELIVF